MLPFVCTFAYAKNGNTLTALNNTPLFSCTYQALSLHRHIHTRSSHSAGDDPSFIKKSDKHSVFVRKTLYHKVLTTYPGSTANIWLICVVSAVRTGMGLLEWWIFQPGCVKSSCGCQDSPDTHSVLINLPFRRPGLAPAHQHQSSTSKYSEWLNASPFCSHRTSQVREREREAVLIHNKI